MYGKKITENQKKIISNANKNKIITEETKEKMRIATKNRFINNPMSKESREKIRNARLGKASVFGENHPKAKLSKNDVLEIREKFANDISIKELALVYGVGKVQILRIIKRQRWKHI